MQVKRFLPFSITVLVIFLAACAPAAQPTEPEVIVETEIVTQVAAEEVIVTQEVEVEVVTATALPRPTQPLPTSAPSGPSPTPVIIEITSTPLPLFIEERSVELEWPESMQLEESAVIRLNFVPTEEGYVAVTEFEGAQLAVTEVAVKHLSDYEVNAVATLDGIGFNISPPGEQSRIVTEGEPLTWRWTVSPLRTGQQRLSITLLLRWNPSGELSRNAREAVIYSKGLTVQVDTAQGVAGAIVGTLAVLILVGGGAGWWLVRHKRRIGEKTPEVVLREGISVAQKQAPNLTLRIEPHPDIHFSDQELNLLRILFNRYGRLVVEREYFSGYSGARTFLALPIRPDGRSDAHTIIKISGRESIQREYRNYQDYVKSTLPPVTARIQGPPVTVDGGYQAVLQYTFIGEPGTTPVSLREALVREPDPELLNKLFSTFGPNWWMQRHPYVFRLAQEYDRKLPAHYVLEPADGAGPVLDGKLPPPGKNGFGVGELVTLMNFPHAEMWADGKSCSLRGHSSSGHPPLRVRWLGGRPTEGITGRVVKTRWTFLREVVAGFDLCGLPDPFERLPEILNEKVRGSLSIIHGDLNLENILVGPGGFVWLIDFAETRDGHPLYDFAHLHAEIIAHVLSPQIDSLETYLAILKNDADPLLKTMRELAYRCLFDSSQLREYVLALYMACLGALKFSNLDAHAKHLLYLTAAHLVSSM